VADLAALIKTDPAREKEGVWYPFIADIRFRIARIDNPEYRRAERNITRELQALARAGGEFAEQAQDERELRLACALVTDWEKVADEGQVLEFSPDNLRAILKKYNTIRGWVLLKASLLEPYRFASDEVGKGNLEGLSAGTASGEPRSDGSHESVPS
jgi:hypothetical protein